MPKFLVTETRREIWRYEHEIEAKDAKEAETIWRFEESPTDPWPFTSSHIDTITVELDSVNEIKEV